MRAHYLMAALLGLAAMPAAAEPGEAALQGAIRLGTLATLAPLCTLRDEAWAEDLRRATIQSSTGTTVQDDAGLRAAPGSNQTISAMGYAEHEALEDFAEAPGKATCDRVAHDPDLSRADRMVRDFRANNGALHPGS